MDKRFDVIIVGAGITGALGATILAKLGYKVLLLERNKHPRFALGESATPLTTYYFEKFAKQFGIPELEELSSYDRMSANTTLNCGPKELFYYMPHTLDIKPNKTQLANEEIVVQTRTVDLQYDRAQLDEYVTSLSVKYGASYIDEINVGSVHFNNSGVEVSATKNNEAQVFKGRFIIDSTGHQSLLAKQMDLRTPAENLDTPLNTRCIFTHFTGVKDLESILGDGENFNDSMSVHRRRGTQHHFFDGGWYWFIPFDNGVTSVGLSLDNELYPINELSAEDEFKLFTERLPVVHELLAGAKNIAPYVKTGRLQFFSHKFVGARWALMPAAVMGMDAWQSTGLTLSFMALDRLIWTLDNLCFPLDEFEESNFDAYTQQLSSEFYHLSRFIHGIYKSFKHKELLGMFCLLPFMGVERFVIDGGLDRPWDKNSTLMNFGNPHWRTHFYRFYDLIVEMNKKDQLSQDDIDLARKIMLEDMALYNNRQYGCPSMNNIYMVEKSRVENAVGTAMSVEAMSA